MERHPGILRHETALMKRISEGLSRLPGITVFRSKHPGCQSGVLSFQVEGKDPGWLADALSERGVAVRSGLHCAPLAHKTAGTLPEGTVRLSVSPLTTLAEIEAFLRITRIIVPRCGRKKSTCYLLSNRV